MSPFIIFLALLEMDLVVVYNNSKKQQATHAINQFWRVVGLLAEAKLTGAARTQVCLQTLDLITRIGDY